MNVDGRLNWALLNWILVAVVVLLIGVNSMIFLYPLWQANRPKRDPLEGKNQASCLKVRDFYSVHLTTYFLAAIGEGEADPKDKAKRYDQYCDKIPGTGKVIFTVDLMEQDARNLSVVLSLSQYDSRGKLELVKELPPNPHPRGVLTLDVPIVKQGKYLLKVAFGQAKTKDDVIEMPILVGK
jgi:hypothetical protein